MGVLNAAHLPREPREASTVMRVIIHPRRAQTISNQAVIIRVDPDHGTIYTDLDEQQIEPPLVAALAHLGEEMGQSWQITSHPASRPALVMHYELVPASELPPGEILDARQEGEHVHVRVLEGMMTPAMAAALERHGTAFNRLLVPAMQVAA